MPQKEKLALTTVSGFHRLPISEKYCLHTMITALTDQDVSELFYQFWIHDPEEGPQKGIKFATQNGKDSSHRANPLQKKEDTFSGGSILPINNDWFPSHGVLKVYAHVLDLEGFAQEIEVGTLTKNDQKEIQFEAAQAERN